MICLYLHRFPYIYVGVIFDDAPDGQERQSIYEWFDEKRGIAVLPAYDTTVVFRAWQTHS